MVLGERTDLAGEGKRLFKSLEIISSILKCLMNLVGERYGIFGEALAHSVGVFLRILEAFSDFDEQG
jgi:hypothetical protein